MLKVNFYDLNSVEEDKLKFAVIAAEYKDKWILVKHKERETWEIPGGHREERENICVTASRELIEETGAKDFSMIPICIYSVDRGEGESYGQLFYSKVHHLGKLPEFEIDEIKLFDNIPENLTYPLIQPHLLKKAEEYKSKKMNVETIDRFSNIQKDIFDNKVQKGFNITNVELEFCLTNGELAEAFEAYIKKLPTVGEELADVAIYLYGIAEILGYDLKEEILNKVTKNKNRIYKDINGVTTRISEG
ncbi:8-oxo-dGTP pyrophosphatase MutT (NUDIX family)/NTP pyrophosphatase (non-canonical NTP hydrolase) [Clostridium punense]|uniref:8-oxo-dGTP pyrophosphatase MutT (NUDIX family)/NTP pyrophosphatase (Non-canonical NTP hydrolase) n=1 Tax=Clostridium punense TaxID=1054297 RepID=A0ABS4K6C9_9CLOT|nr:hypothetical protein M918_00175 [Clostridium sp. BL8]MBP2023342.1 8-oxo-dGTP pyrophosphatase MutT (NUDIX family)/NTP pyrophosphatase (non-canonical NTP hydrolase) [Clostridium punense]